MDTVVKSSILMMEMMDKRVVSDEHSSERASSNSGNGAAVVSGRKFQGQWEKTENKKAGGWEKTRRTNAREGTVGISIPLASVPSKLSPGKQSLAIATLLCWGKKVNNRNRHETRSANDVDWLNWVIQMVRYQPPN